MDGLSRPLGAGPHVTIGQHSLRLDGRILRHYAEIEAQILHRRGKPHDLIRGLSETFQGSDDAIQAVTDAAFEAAKSWAVVGGRDYAEWVDTWPGQCFTIYLAVRDNDRKFYTLDKVTEIVSDEYEKVLRSDGNHAAAEWLGGIIDGINQASGDDELGNSTGGLTSPNQTTTTK